MNPYMFYLHKIPKMYKISWFGLEGCIEQKIQNYFLLLSQVCFATAKAGLGPEDEDGEKIAQRLNLGELGIKHKTCWFHSHW